MGYDENFVNRRVWLNADVFFRGVHIGEGPIPNGSRLNLSVFNQSKAGEFPTRWLIWVRRYFQEAARSRLRDEVISYRREFPMKEEKVGRCV
jgi:hypothetical protein